MWNALKRSWFLNAFFAAIAVAVSLGAYKEVRFLLLLRKEEGIQHAKVAELQKKKEELEAKLVALEHPEGIAREAKERLNLKKPWEEVVVVLPQVSSGVSVAERLGAWDRIKKFLSAVFSF